MNDLKDIPNIGENLQKQLNMVNIFTYDELKQRGSKQTWLDIQKIDTSACLNRLYSLEGAIRSIRWHNLPEDIKKELKNFYLEHKL